MSDPKHSPRPQGTPAPEVASFIRSHDTEPIDVPLAPMTPGSDVSTFLDDWALRHFTASVKLHDTERVCERDPEASAVLEDAAIVQGVLLELHDFATRDPRLRAMMTETHALQNGVSALYGWLDDVLTAASARGIARRRPSFADTGDDALRTILGTLERVHPDLEELVQVRGVDEDIAQKLALCFRQVGAAIVRVSGRASSMLPPL